jgi:hypothetical protein
MSLVAARGVVLLGVFLVLVILMGLLGALGPIELIVALLLALAIAWPLGARLTSSDPVTPA